MVIKELDATIAAFAVIGLFGPIGFAEDALKPALVGVGEALDDGENVIFLHLVSGVYAAHPEPEVDQHHLQHHRHHQQDQRQRPSRPRSSRW